MTGVEKNDLLATEYDGVTQWTNATTDVALAAVGTGPFTFGGSLKTTEMGVMHAFSKGNSEDGSGFFMALDSAERGGFRIGGASIQTPGTINNGVFRHLMITFSESGGTYILYLDGIQVATGTAPTYNITSAGNMTIGVFSDTFSPNWDGSIDGIRMYDSVLDATTVLALSNFQVPE